MNATAVEAPVALMAAPHEGHIYLAVAIVYSERISHKFPIAVSVSHLAIAVVVDVRKSLVVLASTKPIQ